MTLHPSTPADLLQSLRDCERVIDGEIHACATSLLSARDAASSGDDSLANDLLARMASRHQRLNDWSTERSSLLRRLPKAISRTTSASVIFDALAYAEAILSRLSAQRLLYSESSPERAALYAERAVPYEEARKSLLQQHSIYLSALPQ